MLVQADFAVPRPPRSSELGVGGSPPNINEGKAIRSPLMDAVVPEMGERFLLGVSQQRPLPTQWGNFNKSAHFLLLLLKNSDPRKPEPFVQT